MHDIAMESKNILLPVGAFVCNSCRLSYICKMDKYPNKKPRLENDLFTKLFDDSSDEDKFEDAESEPQGAAAMEITHQLRQLPKNVSRN